MHVPRCGMGGNASEDILPSLSASCANQKPLDHFAFAVSVDCATINTSGDVTRAASSVRHARINVRPVRID
eukprot:2549622-Pyramimonas_sp.AAC.1